MFVGVVHLCVFGKFMSLRFESPINVPLGLGFWDVGSDGFVVVRFSSSSLCLKITFAISVSSSFFS